MLWDYFYRTAAWGHFACVAMNYSTPICVAGECSVFLGTLWKKELHLFREEIKHPLIFYMTCHPQMLVPLPASRPRWAVQIHDSAAAYPFPHWTPFPSATSTLTLTYQHAKCHRHFSPSAWKATLPGLPVCQLFLWALILAECVDWVGWRPPGKWMTQTTEEVQKLPVFLRCQRSVKWLKPAVTADSHTGISVPQLRLVIYFSLSHKKVWKN